MTNKEFNKFGNSDIFEGIISISSLLKAYENKTNNRRIIKIFYDESKIKKNHREYAFLVHKSKEHGFSIELTDSKTIEEYTIGNTHGGVIAFCSDRSLKQLQESDIIDFGVYFMLEGIEDPYNFGYSLRSIYASGVDGVILSPRNWMGAAGVVARASAGASELLPMFISTPEDAIEIFKKKGYKIYCADKPNSVSIYDTELKKPIFMLVGGEKRGNSKAVLENVDKIIHIDYGRNFPAALSAASASTVIAFEIMRQNKK